MKKFTVFALLITIIAFPFLKLTVQAEQATDDDTWPREVKTDKTTYKLYEPQIDSWDGYTLQAHCAIAMQKSANQNAAAYGVANFTAKTIVDKEARTVQFENLKIDQVKFPSQPQEEQPSLQSLQSLAPIRMQKISLDRLETNLAINDEQSKSLKYDLDNQPPDIIFSNVPSSILVCIDGEPVFSDVKGTDLARVVNTNVLLLKDKTGKYYLHIFDGYMESTDLTNGWKVSVNPPKDAKTAESITSVDLLAGEEDPDTNKKPSLSAQAPHVYVSKTRAAELIVTQGEPNFMPIDGTNLLYVSNTSANVFKDLDDQMAYVLISGRWFRSSSNTGPWKYVAGSDLPKDFANIPDKSKKENAKASVPGTPQAKEALISNEIPTTTKIDRKTASLKLEIDGEPQLKPIEGTALNYVFNCAIPVIKTETGQFYAVQNGVWFTSNDVKGQWVVADSIPEVIYSIPVTSPMHYVTYVKVYNSTADHVDVGYTAGYYGTVVCRDGTVVYGTGYSYPSYIGRDVWYSPYWTYGFGSDLCWTPWYGWGFSFGFGWGYPYSWYGPAWPYWGPFMPFRNHFHRWEFSTSRNIYRHGVGGWAGKPGSQRAWMHRGMAYNSTTGSVILGHGQAVKNVFRSQSSGRGNFQRSGTVSGGSHIYGTREGNVYSYQQNKQGGSWHHMNGAENRQAPVPNEGTLNRVRKARDTGEARTNSFRSEQRNWGSGGENRDGGGSGGGWRRR